MRTAQGVRFRLFFSLGTLGGVAAALPAPDRPLKPQLVSLVLGGPLASLLLALAAGGLFMPLEGRWAGYALVCALLSLMIFAVTAVPLRAGGFMSDGLQFLELRRNPGMVERRVRLMALVGMGMAGVRPREFDPQRLAEAQALAGQEALYDVGVWMYSYGHAIDQGDVAGAGAWLDRIEAVLESYPDGFRQSVTVELALFEARYRQRLARAQGWMARSKGGVVDASRRFLAEAAIAAAEGRDGAARTALDRARRALPRAMDPGFAHLSVQQIQDLRDELDARALLSTAA